MFKKYILFFLLFGLLGQNIFVYSANSTESASGALKKAQEAAVSAKAELEIAQTTYVGCKSTKSEAKCATQKEEISKMEKELNIANTKLNNANNISQASAINEKAQKNIKKCGNKCTNEQIAKNKIAASAKASLKAAENVQSSFNTLLEKCKTKGTACDKAKEEYSKTVAKSLAAKSEVAKSEILAEAEEKSRNGNLKEKKEALETLAKEACSGKETKACTDAKAAAKEAKKLYDNDKSSMDDITSRSFIIGVNDISPGMKVNQNYGNVTEKNVNFLLGTIITKLLIGMGTLSILIMTVGGGYMVLHGGKDELLNKGKAIFMAGVYSMMVALGAYYLIVAVRWVLYF